MLKLIVSSTFLVLAVTSAANAEADIEVSFTDRIFYGNYKTINNYLVKNVQSDDPQENMNAIIKLDSEYKGSDSKLRESIRHLKDLSTILSEEKMCSKPSELTLRRVQQGTRHRTFKPQSRLPKSMSRIEKLVHHYAFEHAKLCWPVYQKRLDWAWRVELTTNKRKALDKLLEALQESSRRKFGKLPILYNDLSVSRVAKAAQVTIEFMSDSGFDELRNEKTIITFEEFHKYVKFGFKNWVKRDCESYVDYVERASSIINDSIILGDEISGDWSKRVSQLAICKFILDNAKAVEKSVRHKYSLF